MFVDNSQQYLAFTPQVNFPPLIWIFTEGEEIESKLPFKIFSTLQIWLQIKNVNFLIHSSLQNHQRAKIDQADFYKIKVLKNQSIKHVIRNVYYY